MESCRILSWQLGEDECCDWTWILYNNSGFSMAKGCGLMEQSGGRETSEEATVTFQVSEDELAG